MRNLALKTVTVLSFLAFAISARAGGITNNFDSSQNYLIDGVVGDTNWDGVYLEFGDVPGGNPGGSGNGATTIADANNSFPGFLTLRTTRGDWSGVGNDGFFLYKVVSGDFDVSVLSAAPWQAIANHFGGLLVRAYNTNNSGAPASFTSTNTTAENFMALFRCQQFGLPVPNQGIAEIRHTTNSANAENTITDYQNPGTNQTRYWRITRVGDTFSFYWKTNQSDLWTAFTNASGAGGYIGTNGTIVRTDLNGQPVQVGIAEAMFSQNAATAFYSDFELTGPNVNFGGTPPDSPTNVVTAFVNSNSVSVSWDPAFNAAGALVLVRANGTLVRGKPAPGITYNANADFKTTNTSLFNGNSRIVYVGTGTNVTVTGLGGSNNTYQVAVFSYSGVGPATTYSVLPATNKFAGPGVPLSMALSVTYTNIAAGGVTPAVALVTFTSGDAINVTADPTTIWSSSTPGVLTGGSGTVSGLTNGTSLIVANFLGIVGSNGPITVHSPAFVDAFTVPHDYATNGVTGSPWDGLYARAGDVPFQIAGNLGGGAGNMLQMDANMTQPTGLYMRYSQTGWEGNEADGTLLWKRAEGDFQAVVHIRTYDILPSNFVGLMARLAQTNGPPNATFPLGTTNGAAFGTTNATFPNGRENHTRWMRFDEFSISTSSRQNVNGANTARDILDGEANNYWLLMVRSNTTFFFYKKVNYTDSWLAVPAATATLTSAAGQPMQVGVSGLSFGGNNRSVTFDYFSLDATNILPYVPPSAAGAPSLTAFTNTTITLTWTNGPGAAGSIVVVRAGGPVSVQPLNGVTYTADPSYGKGSALGSGNFVVYDGPGTTVTISNVIPGITYYATVYSYSGAGPTIIYNTTESSNGNAVKALGTIRSLLLTVPVSTNVLYGGVGFFNAKVVFDSGVTNDVTSEVGLYFTPPDAGGGGTNGVFTPLTNTPFQINAVYTVLGLSATNTNTLVITTRSPIYVDNFDQNHDYLANGEAGSIFDGAYFGGPNLHPSNAIPGVNLGVGGEGQTLMANANINSNGVLTVQHLGGDWEFNGNDGFLLFKNITGPNFQVSVHVLQADDVFPPDANANVGLIARAAGTAGGTFNGDGEDYVSWSRFDLFAIQNDGRSTLNGATTRLEVRDGSTNYWLMLVRKESTNFLFLERSDTNQPWLLRQAFNTVRADLPQGMQVGLQTAMFSANTGTTMFDHFMLDGTAQRPPMQLSRPVSGQLLISWSTAYSAYALQSTTSLSPPATWSYVSATQTVTNGLISVSVPLTSPAKFYRLGR